MATSKQRASARRNVKKAASAAKRKRTIAHLPKRTRTWIEGTAKKVGIKVEQGLSKAAKKEKHIVDKVARKLKKAAMTTGEGFKKAGEKIENFNS